MSKTRYINTKIWSDPWVVDRLNPLDRHLFFYFLTNEHTSISGVYEASLKTISNEIGIERDEVLRMLKRLEPKVRYINGWVVITNAIKNQNYHSPKIKTGVELSLELCPDDLLKYINWPHDWKVSENIVKRMKTQGSLDLLVYGIDTISHSNSNSNSNSKVAKATVSKNLKNKNSSGYKKAKEARDQLSNKLGVSK